MGTEASVRAQTIRMRLGGSANLLEPFPWKPKGMHLRTYERLKLAATEGELCWCAQFLLHWPWNAKVLLACPPGSESRTLSTQLHEAQILAKVR
jgi:hypothetical protein